MQLGEIEVSEFKEAMAHFATGVSIVTTVHEGRPIGATVNSLTSLSLDPPLILICLNKQMFMPTAIWASEAFAVNVLSADQRAWGVRFATKTSRFEDRFAGIAVDIAVTGSPILPSCIAWLDCVLWTTYEGGDHWILVGAVKAAQTSNEKQPLLYHRRHWRQLAD